VSILQGSRGEEKKKEKIIYILSKLAELTYESSALSGPPSSTTASSSFPEKPLTTSHGNGRERAFAIRVHGGPRREDEFCVGSIHLNSAGRLDEGEGCTLCRRLRRSPKPSLATRYRGLCSRTIASVHSRASHRTEVRIEE
jgi:hypothetical protein